MFVTAIPALMSPTGISTLCHLVAPGSVGLILPLAWLNGVTGDSSADIAANPVTFLGGRRIGLAIGDACKKAGQSQSEDKSAHCRDPGVCVSLYQGGNDSKTRSAAALAFIAWQPRSVFAMSGAYFIRIPRMPQISAINEIEDPAADERAIRRKPLKGKPFRLSDFPTPF